MDWDSINANALMTYLRIIERRERIDRLKRR
jgi:hypothetical protein